MKFANLKPSLFIYSASIGLIFIVSSSPSLNAKEHKNCISSYKIGLASDTNKFKAGKSAIHKWQLKIKLSLGAGWTSWQNAQVKTIPCQFSKRLNIWQCRAIAKPCRS